MQRRASFVVRGEKSILKIMGNRCEVRGSLSQRICIVGTRTNTLLLLLLLRAPPPLAGTSFRLLSLLTSYLLIMQGPSV
jgi:hypothetical protein